MALAEAAAVPPAAAEDDRLFTGPYLWILITNFFAIFNLNLFILLPTFVRGLGGAEGTIGMLMGTHAIVALITRFWIGAWLDRYGRRRFILLGVGLSIVSTTGYFFVDSVGPLMFLCRALHGFAFACYFTAMITLTADTVPVSRRTQALAWTGVAGFTANALAPPVGEAVLAWAGLPDFTSAMSAAAGEALVIAPEVMARVTHAYHALFLVGMGIILFSALCATRIRPAPHEGAGVRGNGVLHVFRQRSMLIVFIPTVAMGIGFGTAFMFIDDFGAVRGLQNVGPFFITYSILVVCLRVGAGRWLDRVNRNAIILPSLAILATGVLLQTQLRDTGWLIVLGLFCGGGHGLLYPTLSAMAYDAVSPKQRGAAMAVFTMGFDGGLAVGTVGLGQVAQGFGYPAMYVTGAAITLLGLGLYAMHAPRGGHFEPVAG